MEHKKYGDDFNVGDIYKTDRITVTETHVVNWAGLTMDYYPLHVDAVYAAQTAFGERLVHGPLVFALAVGLVSKAGFGGDATGHDIQIRMWTLLPNRRRLRGMKPSGGGFTKWPKILSCRICHGYPSGIKQILCNQTTMD